MNNAITNRNKYIFTFKGIDFGAKQLSRILERSVSTIYNRYHKGYAVDAVLRYGKSPKMYKVDKESMTAKEISARFGISLQTVYNKVGKFPTRTVFSAKMFIKY